MKKLRRDSAILLGLSVLLISMSYIFFRYAYRVADQFPFSQEIILAFVGAIITILITAVLLNKQTEVEVRKEGIIKYLELKSQIYMDLLDHLERIMQKGKAEPSDILRLKFLNHKIAVIASPEVLLSFEEFIKAFTETVDDPSLEQEDKDKLMRDLSKLTIAIREDLVGHLDEQTEFSHSMIASQIKRNADILEDFD
jgi:hypothetical protein